MRYRQRQDLSELTGLRRQSNYRASAEQSRAKHQRYGLHWLLLAAALITNTATSAETDATVDGNLIMRLAVDVLANADNTEAEARNYILTANQLRKQINQQRAAERKIGDPSQRQALQASIDALAAQLSLWQQRGGDLRQTSKSLRNSAQALMIEGFSQQWQQWITAAAPLVMEAVEYEVLAHNSQVRSVHPTLLELRGSTDQLPERYQGMSIRVPSMSDQQTPVELNVSSFQVSRDRRLFAHIEVAPDASGQSQPVPLNSIHQWRLLLGDLHGRPIRQAKIDIVGHMPGHVHGLPTQPQVTDEIAPGVYRIEGMKFQMNGWWVIEFVVQQDGRDDTVKFNLLL